MIKLVDIYKKELPEFNYEDYRDYDEYHYRHDIDGALIDDEISNVKVVQRDRLPASMIGKILLCLSMKVTSITANAQKAVMVMATN